MHQRICVNNRARLIVNICDMLIAKKASNLDNTKK
ncbi:MAG: hypothetical protein ACI8S3_002338 [Alphaproteobacteria bacterium]|jgi:hypothetical protein